MDGGKTPSFFIMVTKEEMSKIAEEEKKTFIKISRVPTNIKQIFTEIADEDFCGDYGMLLKFLIEQTSEYQRVKDVLLDKQFMSYILEKRNQEIKNQEKTESEPKVKMFGDRIAERRSKEKNE